MINRNQYLNWPDQGTLWRLKLNLKICDINIVRLIKISFAIPALKIIVTLIG